MLNSAGFVEIQINGFNGVDFNSAKPDKIAEALLALLKGGVTSVYPTVITASSDRMLAAMASISSVAGWAYNNLPRIEGIHVEGPAISRGQGKGCHPMHQIRTLTKDEVLKWQEVTNGRIKIITLAPEVEGSLDLIPWLVENQKIVVGIGHTDADNATILEAVDRGASLSTHLWNASAKMLNRMDGLGHIGAQLAEPRLTSSIIADGQHVHRNCVMTTYLWKGSDGMILTTDAMAGAAASDGVYSLGETKIPVIEGIARDPMNHSQFAGSTLEMQSAVRRLVELNIPFEEVIEMVTSTPRRLMGLPDYGDTVTWSNNLEILSVDRA